MPRRSRKASRKSIENKIATCAGIWKPSGEMITEEALKDKVICLSERKRHGKRYYISNDVTGKLDYIGQNGQWAYCVADPEIRKKIQCDIIEEIDKTDSDYIKVANYITLLSLHMDVEPYIVNFIEDLLIYTNVTPENISEILNGAFVLLEGDDGIFYDKYHSNNYMYVTKKQGTSSHYSIIKQARIGSGKLLSMKDTGDHSHFFDLLMGKNIIIDGQPWNPKIAEAYKQLGTVRELRPRMWQGHTKHTWFQFEKARGTKPDDGNFIANYRNKPTMFNLGHIESTVYYYGSLASKNIGPFGNSIYTEKKPLKIKLCKKLEKGPGYGRMLPCNLKKKTPV